MKLNVENLKKLMQEKYNNNYHEFSRQTGVDVTLLHHILTGKRNAGLKTINTLISFFKKNDLEIKNYISLP